MVKDNLKRMPLFVLFIISFVSAQAFGNQAKDWALDSDFSAYLTIMAGNYKALTNSDIADKVDMIRVYQTSGRDGRIVGIDELLSQRIVFESNSKQAIREILLAAQAEELNIPNCYQNRTNETYYIAAFNDESRHVGYFLLNICKEKEFQAGIIRPFQKGDSSAIYYNESLIKVLKRMRIIE